MRAEILTNDDLTREDIEAFWAQGVDMDDWDWMILAPVTSVKEEAGRLRQTDSVLYHLTENFYREDCWYRATFRGVEYAVGLKYH